MILLKIMANLKEEIEKAIAAGLMDTNPMGDFDPTDMSDENYAKIDLHRHIMDTVVLVSPSGKAMKRESDLIDVWFDSGSMPYAQWHYPFENKDKVEDGGAFPANFIAEGVDQTRGWFFTLHAISSMVFDSVAYKNVISNGLVLDKNGMKMSKRLGNAVDPFTTTTIKPMLIAAGFKITVVKNCLSRLGVPSSRLRVFCVATRYAPPPELILSHQLLHRRPLQFTKCDRCL